MVYLFLAKQEQPLLPWDDSYTLANIIFGAI